MAPVKASESKQAKASKHGQKIMLQHEPRPAPVASPSPSPSPSALAAKQVAATPYSIMVHTRINHTPKLKNAARMLSPSNGANRLFHQVGNVGKTRMTPYLYRTITAVADLPPPAAIAEKYMNPKSQTTLFVYPLTFAIGVNTHTHKPSRQHPTKLQGMRILWLYVFRRERLEKDLVRMYGRTIVPLTFA